MKIDSYTIKNIWLKIRSWVGSKINGDGSDFESATIFWDCVQVFNRMDTTTLDALYGRTMPWGQYYPNQLQEWFDGTGVSIDSNGVNFRWTDNKLTAKDGTIIKNGIGFIVSKDSYGYGDYEWEILMPLGVGLWPAIWISAKNSWPPEIDLMEGYSDENGKYRLKSNIHRQGIPGNTSDGAMEHGYLVDVDVSIKLSMVYTADSVKMYYNGWFVREERGFGGNPEMLVIMGIGLRANFNYTLDRAMTVKSFKYRRV